MSTLFQSFRRRAGGRAAGLGTATVVLAAVLCGCSASGSGREDSQAQSANQAQVVAGGEQKVERRWDRLYGNALFRLIEEKPLAWLPLGILEEHGEQLPWELDGEKAHLVCIRLADKMGGVVLPVNQYAGVHGDRKPDQSEEDFRRASREVKDFMFTEDYLRRFLWECFEGLSNLGVEVIVAYTGHYPQIQTQIVKEMAEKYTATGRAVVIPFWEPLACGEGDHASKWECSIWEALVPGGVHLDSIVDYRTGQKGWYRGKELRSQVSREFGEKALATVEGYLRTEIDRAFSQRQQQKESAK